MQNEAVRVCGTRRLCDHERRASAVATSVYQAYVGTNSNFLRERVEFILRIRQEKLDQELEYNILALTYVSSYFPFRSSFPVYVIYISVFSFTRKVVNHNLSS